MNKDLKSANSAKTGIIFKARREELGLTISEVSNKYMINIKYLRSIESGSYSGFPSEGFARAYFRKYSNILDIKPEFPAVYAVQNRKDEIINKSYKSINNPFVKILIGLAGLALLILIVIISMLPKSTSKDIKVLEPNLSVSENIQVLIPDTFSVDDNNSHDNQNSSLANKITKKNIVELPKIIPSATKNNLTVPALTSPIKKTAQRILNDININNELLLFFDNECWVEIQAGSNILLSELYSKGDSLSLSVAYPFSLKVGNVYAIKGTYQGLDIDFITGADRLNVNTIFYLND
jgi:cytoskeletal protein RodZ